MAKIKPKVVTKFSIHFDTDYLHKTNKLPDKGNSIEYRQLTREQAMSAEQSRKYSHEDHILSQDQLDLQQIQQRRKNPNNLSQVCINPEDER